MSEPPQITSGNVDRSQSPCFIVVEHRQRAASKTPGEPKADKKAAKI